MRFGSHRAGGTERAAVLLDGAGPHDLQVLAAADNAAVPSTLDEFVRQGGVDAFRAAAARPGRPVSVAPLDRPHLVCPLRRPPKIWDI
jgi:hypothetical protein